jgi:hypothetical protein
MKTNLFTINGQRRTANGFSPFSILRFPFSVLLIALAIVACEEKQAGGDDPAVTPTLLVSPASIPATAAAGNYTIDVTCNTAWTAAVNSGATWCTVQPTSGNNNGTVAISVAENLVVETRTATITVAAGTLTKQVTVTQAAAAPVLNVDKATIDATVAANSYPIGVTSNLTWTAAVNSGATWCTLTNANATTGNGTVTVNVAENPTVETRTATVTLTSGTLTKAVAVTQAAAVPTLEVGKTTIDAAVAANSYPIGVTSNLTWTATVNSAATWCTLTNATATGNGTVTVNIAANPSGDQRAATVMLSAGTFTRQVSITQAGASPTLSVDKTSLSFNMYAGSESIAVNSNMTWTTEVDAGTTWCTILPSTGTGNGMVMVSVAENTTSNTRTATVFFIAGTLYRQVTITQAPALTTSPTTINLSASIYTSDKIQVTSSLPWTANVNVEAFWCMVTPAIGTGNGTITVSATQNTAFEVRAATVTITAGTLTRQVSIRQAGATPSLTIIPSSIDARSPAHGYTIAVTSNIPWTANVNTGWCTLANASATGNGTITVNVAANATNVIRAATVTVAAGTLTRAVGITQKAVPYVSSTAEAPPYAASNKIWVFSAQTWSDLIQIPECNKDNFPSSTTEPQCRSFSSSTATLYLYNWPFVNQRYAYLCPSPWRAPSHQDMEVLYVTTDVHAMMDAWVTPVCYGGLTQETRPYWAPSGCDHVWSTTLASQGGGMFLSISEFHGLYAWGNYERGNAEGYTVRCVK